MKKRGFTLSEILMSMAIIGILISIMIPTVQKVMPDKDRARVKKAYNTLTNVIEGLTNDGDVYYNGLLGKMPNGEDVENKSYFCQQFADKVNTTSDDITCDENIIKLKTQTVESSSALDDACEEDEGDANNRKKDKKYAFKTTDGIYWYGMYDDKSFTVQTLVNGIDKRYVVVCIDTNFRNSNITDTIYGFGVRRDGRIIIGQKAQAILDEDRLTK